MTAAQPQLADPAPDPAGSGVPGGYQTGADPALPALARILRGQRIRSDRPSITRWVLLVWLSALIALTLNHQGQMFFDTKLGVDIDPLGFYQRLWHLWNPLEWLGALQDQYIGYAFPMAPFYLLGQFTPIPVWFIQRLWLALLVAVGFAGLVKLAEALRIGRPATRLAAGLAFAAWPTFTIVIGSTSAGALPGLLAPWAVLPLAKASGAASDSARAGGRSLVKAAARSGLAVLCMGGVNATSTLDVLILPALFIVTQFRGRRRALLAAYWSGSVVLATSWWLVPLLLQARYSFNFLPYVEQSATTTGTMSAAAVLRGTGNWTAYLNLGQPWLPAGWVMVSNPVAIMAAAIAAGTGLLGLTRRDLAARNWLALSLAAAALIALAGYGGPLGGPFHSVADRLLNNGLAPLRSVYKIEPVIAVVLTLGIAHALAVATAVRPSPTRQHASMQATKRALAAMAAVLVVPGLIYPYLTDQVLNPGAFTAIPGYWYRVAAFLQAHSPRTPALVVPGAAHGSYLWGEPVDDPLEPLAASPWTARGLVPYGGPGSQLLISSLQDALTSGKRVPGLAALLQRTGIGYVVVRNDLNPGTLDYTPPTAVHATLLASGFGRVAAFGPRISGAQYDPGAPQIQYALPSYPAVEIYAPDQGTGRIPPPAAALPVAATTLVNGGPDGLLQLAGQRLLSGAPAVIAGDRLVTRPARWLVTDSLRRADHAFGLISSVASYTYTPAETNPVDDPLGGGGGPPRQLLPVPAAGHQTVAVLAGAASVTASSSGSWLTETPAIDPVNAFDGNGATYWTESNPASAVGQWIQITFSREMSLPDAIAIKLLDDGPLRPVADRLKVSTAAGSVIDAVRPVAAAQPLPVPPGPTRTLRITFAGVRGGVPSGSGAGISDVFIPGLQVRRFLQPAQSRAGLGAPAVAFSFHRETPSPASLANAAAYPPIAELFRTASPASFRLSGYAVAQPGRALNAILARLTPSPTDALEVTASSSLGSLPGLAAAGLFSGHSGAWIAGGPNPVIRLSWRGMRVISQMIIQPLVGFAAAPEAIKITSPNGARFASVGIDGLTAIVPPLRTSRMTISFPVVQFAPTAQPVTGQYVQLPVGLSRLSIPALAGLRTATPAADARFRLGCGQGPEVTIDGHRYLTSVWGTVGDLTRFLPVNVRLCQHRRAGAGTLTLGAGTHRLVAGTFGPLTLTDLSLTSVPPASAPARGGSPAAAVAPAAASAPRRSVRVLGWQPEQRQLRIGPGQAAYLELHQNFNPGWTATLRGRELAAVRLDGWQQAFVVPAGAGGVVTLTFAPVGLYHAAIIASAAGVLLMLTFAFARRRRRKAPAAVGAIGSGPPAQRQLDAGTPAGRTAGWLGLPRSAWAAGAGVIALTVLLITVGGPVALAVPVLLAAAAWQPQRFGLIALAAMVVAGAATAVAAHPAAAGSGAFGPAAQVCALIALAVPLTPILRPARRGAGRPLASRFGPVDELTCWYDCPAEPANVHLEAWLSERLDEDRLRACVRATLAAQHRARARRRAGGRWRSRSHWEYPSELDTDPVNVSPAVTEAELADWRAGVLSAAPSLDRSPPLRFWLARGADHDRVLLNAHHAALDGLSCLDLLKAVAAAYHGEPAGVDDHGAERRSASAQGPAAPPAATAGENAGQMLMPRRARGRLPRRAVRIAACREAGQPRDLPGYGACLVTWDGLAAAADRLRATGGTVNDLLIAAMVAAIAGWNAALGRRHSPIRITMPIGDRAMTGVHGRLGHTSRLATIRARPRAGASCAELIDTVSAQALKAKNNHGPQLDLASRFLGTVPFPLPIRRWLLRTGLRVGGSLLCDTSLVSNLGVIEPLRFGTATADDVWFSTSAHMPRGMSLGAVTVGGRLHLTFRYRRTLLSDAAAARFAGRYLELLDGFAGREEGMS